MIVFWISYPSGYYNSAPSGGTTGFNVNISGMIWGTPSKSDMLYRFVYDGANQLNGADFYKSGYSTAAFDCTYGYDFNGNITSIVRKGSTGSFENKKTAAST